MIMTRNNKFLPGHTSTNKGNLIVFSFKALQTATNYFHNKKFIGKGSFGYVYKGMIHERSLAAAKIRTTIVVVKYKLDFLTYIKCRPVLTTIFILCILFILTLLQAAVNCLGLIDHPNLIKLIGYYTDDDHKLFVYEYMERGSLENYLFRTLFYSGPLAWNLRIKIALGAVKGLAYLHKPESIVMCHDFNSTSILIDSDGPVDSSGQVIYTKGYADPEYIKTGNTIITSVFKIHVRDD
ncbi:putative transferase, protein kinase RLK-Pelle-RLCK-VIIa-2 family [Helianthus anomalus]